MVSQVVPAACELCEAFLVALLDCGRRFLLRTGPSSSELSREGCKTISKAVLSMCDQPGGGGVCGIVISP